MASPKIRTKWSILIVDDEFPVRESFRMILKPFYEIHTVPDGEEALSIIKKRKIQFVTMDLNMPKLSGIETFPVDLNKDLLGYQISFNLSPNSNFLSHDLTFNGCSFT